MNPQPVDRELTDAELAAIAAAKQGPDYPARAGRFSKKPE